MYEPSSPQYLYKLAFKRANRIREVEGVDEDVLVIPKLQQISERNNCNFQAEFFPFHQHRESITSTSYYYLLSKFSILQRLLVSTVNIVIEKK